MPHTLTRRAFLALTAVAVGGALGVAGATGVISRAPMTDQTVPVGELTLVVQADPWRMILSAPNGDIVWQEPLDQTLSFRTPEGQIYRARRMASCSGVGSGGVQMTAETDDPLGGAIALEVQQVGPRAFRMRVTADRQGPVAGLGGAFEAAADERFVGFGERFDSVNQRGRVLDVWAEDRRVANYGASTYAPLPLLLSSRGHSFALERFERSRFDLAASQADRWSWQQDAPSTSIVVGYGPSLKDLVRRNVELTGLPPLPPAWTFGVWKTSVGGADAVIDEMRRLRAQNIPISAVFSFDAVDSNANLGWPDVTFAGRRAGQYPDPAAYTST
ncbi:MAG TPA: hypothetical protein VFG86_16335, partial [Chloroflexota bacterium]|nr:hypothetical protein [Chloroflexota bacterium]